MAERKLKIAESRFQSELRKLLLHLLEPLCDLTHYDDPSLEAWGLCAIIVNL